MPKFYPSSSAFMLGDTVVTKYNSGCLRSILIKANGIREDDISSVYQDVGAAAEDNHEQTLIAKGLPYIKELVVKAPLSKFGVQYSGRVDFYVNDNEVHEVKGLTSKNTRRDVIRQGKYNVSYLAQVVSYMVKLRVSHGELICGYFEDDEGQLICQESRTFKVELDAHQGDIWVDGEPSGYCVADLLAHQQAAVEVLETGVIAGRPEKAYQKYDSPCTYCPFKEACDRHDKEGLTTEQFLWAAQDAVDGLESKPPPLVNKVKKPRAKKVKK